jgi:thymidine phosphorylase
VFNAMIAAQGGDATADLPRAGTIETVVAPAGGFMDRLEARAVGVAAWRLGAGRARKTDPVSPTAGVVCLVKPGEAVEKGQPMLELHTDEPDRLARARDALADAIEIGPEPRPARALVIDVLR